MSLPLPFLWETLALLLYAAAIFVSAALLFLVQPLIGKLLLPVLGGSPSVWNTCMVFFQAVLLLGYFYSHLLSKIPKLATQTIIHVVVIVAAAVALPIALRTPTEGAESTPILWLLSTLATTVGMPFFCVATTGPLVQRWFSLTNHKDAKDPYFLYAASNLGSMVGLLAFPICLEPFLTRGQQSDVWTVGFGLLAILLLLTAATTWRQVAASASQVPLASASAPLAQEPSVGWLRRLRWILLAFVPSSLMLGVTQSISTDVAAVPLLWIVPLLLYLGSFVLAFSRIQWMSASLLGRIFPIAIFMLLAVVLTGAKSPLPIIVFVHVATFFIASCMCHRAMAEDRPGPARLTEFYLWMSVGGVLGGIWNALAAPVIFDSVLEYPIALALACFARPQTIADFFASRRVKSWVILGGCVLAAVLLIGAVEGLITLGISERWADGAKVDPILLNNALRTIGPCLLAGFCLMRGGSLRFACVVAVLAISAPLRPPPGFLLEQERTFFGVHRVVQNPERTWTTLHHGTTLHGVQIRSEDLPPPPEGLPPINAQTLDDLFFQPRQQFTRNQRIALSHRLPLTYYHPTGPIGDVMRLLIQEKRLTTAAFVGMGTGSLAAYGRPGMTFHFFEIDEAVARIAANPEYFSYLSSSLADNGRLFLGDGRVQIALQDDATYDLIVIDAFSSDAIPVHLITREALQVYLAKLKPNGILAFHISNRYFDLQPVLSRLAALESIVGYQRRDIAIPSEELAEAKKDSDWVVLCREPSDFGQFARMPTWVKLNDSPRNPTWTDDYSNILSIFVGW